MLKQRIAALCSNSKSSFTPSKLRFLVLRKPCTPQFYPFLYLVYNKAKLSTTCVQRILSMIIRFINKGRVHATFIYLELYRTHVIYLHSEKTRSCHVDNSGDIPFAVVEIL